MKLHEKFWHTKGVIRGCKSKEDRQILNLPSPLPTLPRLPGVREDSLSKYSPGFLAAKQKETFNTNSQTLLS
jgi:hypothetical protein